MDARRPPSRRKDTCARHGGSREQTGPLANGFELNDGQWDSRVKFPRWGIAEVCFLPDSGFVIALSQPAHSEAKSSSATLRQKQNHRKYPQVHSWDWNLFGANPHPKIAGGEITAGKSN